MKQYAQSNPTARSLFYLQPRWWILWAFLACLGTGLLLRLIDVQLVRGSDFLVKADDNRYYSERVEAERGVLLDRYGQPLVWNVKNYVVRVDPKALHGEIQPIAREEALRLLASNSAGVEARLSRLYRYPESLSQVLGYVGAVSGDDLKRDTTLDIRQMVGKLGLERSYDEIMRGHDGVEVFEINALGQRQRSIKTQPALNGHNVTTTLDPALSEVAFAALGSQRGTVIISDASTGAVLSLVSKPSFNANIFDLTHLTSDEKKQRQLELQSIFTDSRQLFFNRAVSGSYPPGSIFKVVTALAGLEKGAFDESTTVVDEGILRVGEYEYRNWYFTQYGRTEGAVNVVRALARSNDIYFYKAAEWIGPDSLAVMARQFGFGAAPGSVLGAEAKGLVPDPEWKEKVIGEQWYLGNTYHYGIGQGDLLVTPLQVNQMIQAVAHQGTLCTPNFRSDESPVCRELGITPEHAETVMTGMLDACSPGGTAFPFFPRNGELRQEGMNTEQALNAGAVACKTGTAEFGGRDARGYRPTHGWFVAIVEPHLPASSTESLSTSNVASSAAWLAQVQQQGFPKRLVITVLVESDEQNLYKEGSREAAPVAKTILDWIEGKAPAQSTPAQPTSTQSTPGNE